MKPARPDPVSVPLDAHGRAIRAEVVDSRYREQDNRWYWRARIESNGQRQDVPDALTLQGRPCRWLTPAEAHWALMQYATSQIPGQTAEPPRRLRTVEDLCNAFAAHLEKRKDLAQQSRRNGKIYLTRVVNDPIGHEALSTLNVGHLSDMQNRFLAEGLASWTIHGIIKVFRQAWAWARELKDVPDRKLGKPKLEVKCVNPKLVMRDDQAAVLVEQLRGWHRVFFLLIVATGARPGELGLLRVEHLAELNMGWVQIPEEGKVGTRQVFIEERGPAAVALRELIGDRRSGPVWPVRFVGVQFRAALQRAREKVGLPALTPYSGRRRVCREMRRRGIDIDVRVAMLGHGKEVHGNDYDLIERPDVVEAIKKVKIERLPRGKVLQLKREA